MQNIHVLQFHVPHIPNTKVFEGSVSIFQPEGIPEEYTIPVLLDLRDQATFEQTLDIALPDDVVEGSANIRVSVIGMITVVQTVVHFTQLHVEGIVYKHLH